jgi:hypothetical protein
MDAVEKVQTPTIKLQETLKIQLGAAQLKLEHWCFAEV